jgi:predicted negative regulator of RcsB-dependent stress response
MEPTEILFELFDGYLNDELTVEERVEFEDKLKNDPAFSAEFEDFKAMTSGLRDLEIRTFKDNLTHWEPTESEKKSAKIIRWPLLVAVAALAIIGFVLVNFMTSQPSAADLFASNFEPYDNVITVRGEVSTLDKGLELYDQKKYAEAIEQFKVTTSDARAQFYLAESYLAVNDFKAAISGYETILTKAELSVFHEIATYHLALAHLGNEDVEGCEKILNSIQSESSYFTVAQALLSDLK